MAGLWAPASAPSRAVAVLCITQVLGWAALFYPPGLTMPHIAAAHGLSLAQALSGFSIALAVSGLAARSPAVDRPTRRPPGEVGRRAARRRSACCCCRSPAASPSISPAGCWAGMPCLHLYDPAFTALARNLRHRHAPPITPVTFAGGLASSVAWPATQHLIAPWRLAARLFCLRGGEAFVIAPSTPSCCRATPSTCRRRPAGAPPPSPRRSCRPPACRHPDGGRVRRPFRHAVRHADASADDPAARRHRCRHRGRDRRDVRAGAGPEPHRRLHVRRPAASAPGGAARHGGDGRRLHPADGRGIRRRSPRLSRTCSAPPTSGDHRARRSADALSAPPATAAWSAASRGRRSSARP